MITQPFKLKRWKNFKLIRLQIRSVFLYVDLPWVPPICPSVFFHWTGTGNQTVWYKMYSSPGGPPPSPRHRRNCFYGPQVDHSYRWGALSHLSVGKKIYRDHMCVFYLVINETYHNYKTQVLFSNTMYNQYICRVLNTLINAAYLCPAL